MDYKDKILKEEMDSVKQLGDKIGYGNLMSWASALWRRKLVQDGFQENGAFVPRIGELEYGEKIYDSWVDKFENKHQ